MSQTFQARPPARPPSYPRGHNGGPPLEDYQTGRGNEARGGQGVGRGPDNNRGWGNQPNPNDGPRMLANVGWTRSPNHNERQIISTLESDVREAEQTYEHNNGRIHSVRPSHALISPEAYIDMLHQRYNFAEGRNAQTDAGRAWELQRRREASAAIDNILMPRQGTLFVGPYGGRETGDRRSWDRSGTRNDADHRPSSGAIDSVYGSDAPSRDGQVSRMIPYDLHQQFNSGFSNQSGYGETLEANTRRSLDYQAEQLRERGYSKREIRESNDRVMQGNLDLGLFNSTRQGDPSNRQPQRPRNRQ